MNNGERDELLAVIRLVQIRDASKELPRIGKVNSVGFKDRVYISPPWRYDSGMPIRDILENELISATRAMRFQKAGRDDKADVYVNGLGISLKSMRSAPPAIVNHTARPGWVRICEQIGHDIRPLDTIIDNYWQLRLSGYIKEDVSNSDSRSPFRLHKEYLKPLLAYFLFTGTGSRDSASPADYILDFTDPLNEASWTLFDENGIVDQLWPRLVFSIRSKKGMPPNYPDIADLAKKKSIARWTMKHQEEHRGALHVRVKAI